MAVLFFSNEEAGKLRAFVQFEDVSQATAFVKEHFPKLHLELRHSTDNAPDGIFEAYVHFARSRDEGDPRRKDWTCPLVCTHSSHFMSTHAQSQDILLTHTSVISSTTIREHNANLAVPPEQVRPFLLLPVAVASSLS